MPIRDYNYSNVLNEPQPLNLTWFKLPMIENGSKLSIQFPKGVKQIDVPKYDDLKTVTLDDFDLQNNVNHYLSKVNVHRVPWYFWLILSVIAFVIFAIVACKCQKYFKRTCKSFEIPTVSYDHKNDQVNLEGDDDMGINE